MSFDLTALSVSLHETHDSLGTPRGVGNRALSPRRMTQPLPIFDVGLDRMVARVGKKKITRIVVNKDYFEWHQSGGSRRVSTNDVISVQYRPSLNPNVVVFCFKPKGRKRKLKQYDIALGSADTNMTFACSLHGHSVIYSIKGLNMRRNYAVLVEQTTGKGYGLNVFLDIVQPTLSICSDYLQVTISEIYSPGNGQTITQVLSSDLDGILIVGGDHLFLEVVDSLANREDKSICAQSWKIGIIPAGASNILAHSMISQDPREALLFCLKDKYEPKDVQELKRLPGFPQIYSASSDRLVVHKDCDQLVVKLYSRPTTKTSS